MLLALAVIDVCCLVFSLDYSHCINILYLLVLCCTLYTSSQLIQYCCTVLLCRARKLRAMNSAIIANMCIRTCIYGCTQICMPTGAYIATKRDFAYVSVPYHAITACKFSYGSVTVCGYFAVIVAA